MIGVTRENKVKNECIRKSIRVASVVDKIRENRFRLFGHEMKKKKLETVRAIIEMNVEIQKK